MKLNLLAALGLLAPLGCHSTDVQVDADAVTKRILNANNLDILFVVDDSASTSDKQMLFMQNFPAFIDALEEFPNGMPNVHIGVVSTTVDISRGGGWGSGYGSAGMTTAGQIANDYGGSCMGVGEDGLLQTTPRFASCTAMTGTYLTGSGSAGDLADAFSCIATLGTSGCGLEAPLEAMKRALDGEHPENAGFLRDDAYLAVVILTDEDDASIGDTSLLGLPGSFGTSDFFEQPLYAYDCDQSISPTVPGAYTNCKPQHGGYLVDPAAYVSFLASIKDPSQTAVALIAGDPTPNIATGPITQPFAQAMALLPSCTTAIDGDTAIARPAIRLDSFRSGFDAFDHGIFETVCQADYSGALTQIGDKLFTMMSSCLEGDIDTTDQDASNPGLQPACIVTEQISLGSNAIQNLPLPACTMLDATTPSTLGPQPCWWVSSSPACQTPSDLQLQIEGQLNASDPISVTCKTN